MYLLHVSDLEGQLLYLDDSRCVGSKDKPDPEAADQSVVTCYSFSLIGDLSLY